MKKNAWIVMLVAAAWTVGCSTSPESAADKGLVSVRLNASRQNAGETGEATLAPRGDQTSISFVLSGVPPDTTRPVRLYTYIYPGTCGTLGTKPAYELNDTIETERSSNRPGAWTFSRTAPVKLSDLRANRHAIVLRMGPQDGNVDIFCGDIA